MNISAIESFNSKDCFMPDTNRMHHNMFEDSSLPDLDFEFSKVSVEETRKIFGKKFTSTWLWLA